MKIASSKTTWLLAGIVVLGSMGCHPASAQFPGLKEFDPFNKNSKVRERGRATEKAVRTEAGRFADGYKRAHGIPSPLDQGNTQFRGYNEIQFRYSIFNSTQTVLRYRLPSGKIYNLPPGKRGSYIFTGYQPNAVIHVFNTGRNYNLRAGDHKFWVMRDGSVGFDMNYHQ